MNFHPAAVALAGLLAIAGAAPATAQTTTDVTAFSTACLSAQIYLIGDLPAEIDPVTVMTPLCACLATAFSTFSQPEVDMLATDLRGEGSVESRTAYPGYEALEEKAREGTTACLTSPEVLAALGPQAAQ